MERMNLQDYKKLTKPSAKRSKYNAKRVIIDGIKFDSTWEGQRYSELKILERSGEITDLKLQVPFKLELDSVNISGYIADFTYHKDGKYIVEDAKGFLTKEYKIKKKLMLVLYKIDILETRRSNSTHSKK
jgi:hypothetical protein